VLMDDNFKSIVNAIKWGRNVFDCIRKFLQFQMTVTTVAVVLSVVGSVLWEESPLSPIQMLWINLIFDTCASLALATEAPTEQLLQRLPYGRNESLITHKMWRFIIGNAVLQLAVTFFLVYSPQLLPWLGLPSDTKDWTDRDHLVAQTVVFNTFVLLQLFNMFHARKLEDEWTILSGLCSNWLFWSVFAVSATLQALIVQFGREPASTTPLNLMQWASCIIAGSLSLPWGFVLRLIPIRNADPSIHTEPAFVLDSERHPLLPPYKSRAVSDARANAHAAWRRLERRISIISMLRRPRTQYEY